MIIHLKKNERLFINGAVIRLDRRGSVELMNDAQFLLENHVMQPEAATTPLRQLYFVVQAMLMDPARAEMTRCLFDAQVLRLKTQMRTPDYVELADAVAARIDTASYYEALKILRRAFALDDAILAGAVRTEVAA